MSPKRKRDDDASSSDESSGSHPQSTRTQKDRECLFCHQVFTSSSLGRHLDLYIRPNPKQPDGIHDVDAIRKLRGGITRRQPKGSKKEESREPETSRQLPKLTYHVNGMDWRGTGVINELPVPLKLPPIALSVEEQIETGKAAELALQEVLNSIKSARKDNKEKELLNFPGMCLAMLQPPKMLFSTTPMADKESWSLTPPGVREKAMLPPGDHLEDVYDQWQNLENKQEIWTMEVLRFFAKTKKENDELTAQLSYAQQRIKHLENEYELLSSCQLPRERMNLPTTVPANYSELPSAAALIDKWRTNVRSVARKKSTTLISYAESTQPSAGKEPGTRDLSADMIMSGAVFGIGGPMSRSAPVESGRTSISKMVDHG